MTPLSIITVLGAGAVGGAVTKTLLDHGHQVHVWNRSHRARDALVEQGASPIGDVSEALNVSDLVLVCLTDYPAAEQVLSSVSTQRTDVPPTLVMLTTGTPAEASRMHDLLHSRGIRFLDAGVQAAPEHIGTDKATFLYSGSETAFATHRATLDLLGEATSLGSDPTAAATWDLALFGLWYDAQLGLLRAFDTLPDSAEARRQFSTAAARQLGHVVEATAATAEELSARDYPRGPASLDEHLPLLRQLHDARRHNRLGDGGLHDVSTIVETLSREGHGRLGLTAVVAPALLPS